MLRRCKRFYCNRWDDDSETARWDMDAMTERVCRFLSEARGVRECCIITIRSCCGAARGGTSEGAS